MTIGTHDATFAGKTIADWEPGQPVPPPRTTAVRLALDWDQYEKGETMPDRLRKLAALPEAREIEALVILGLRVLERLLRDRFDARAGEWHVPAAGGRLPRGHHLRRAGDLLDPAVGRLAAPRGLPAPRGAARARRDEPRARVARPPPAAAEIEGALLEFAQEALLEELRAEVRRDGDRARARTPADCE